MIVERILVAKSTNIKIIDVKADLKNVFGRLAGWLGPWEGIRQDHITGRPRPGRNRT